MCGREFGSKSIGIHLPKCAEKRKMQQAKLPRELRTPAPKKPPGYDQYISTGSGFNANGSGGSGGVAMGETPIGGGGSSPADMQAAIADAAFAAYNEALVPCKNCGRTFNPESLLRHANACTPDKPMVRRSKTLTPSAASSSKPGLPPVRSPRSSSGTTVSRPSTVSRPRSVNQATRPKPSAPAKATAPAGPFPPNFYEAPPCDNCEDPGASVWCEDCGEALCDDCSPILHKKAAKASHGMKTICIVEKPAPPPKCDHCEVDLATVSCVDCLTADAPSKLCGECDGVLHKKPSMAVHKRVGVQASVSSKTSESKIPVRQRKM